MAKRKPFTPEERQAYLEGKQRQREELETRVKGLVDSFRDSDTFKNYLSQMSEFNRRCNKYLHRYSPNNLLMIVMQDPTAQVVGSFSAWRKMGRPVKKGETSHIQVWAPMRRAAMQKKLDDDGNPILDADGKPEMEPVRDENGRVMRVIGGGFKLEPVFDISQTEGEPLPTLAQELKNPVENFADYEAAIRDISPLPIYYSDAPEAEKMRLGEAKGVCSFSDKMIVIKAGMSEEHTIKTMVHEVTHAKFHSPDKLTAALDEDGTGFSRNEIEVQAECTAFVVCDHFGLDTSDYSIPYIMSWGEDRKLTPFTKSLDVILKTSDEIISGMETYLWKEMGIDEKLDVGDRGLGAAAAERDAAGTEAGAAERDAPNAEASASVPALFNPALAIDPSDPLKQARELMSDPMVETLLQAGYEARVQPVSTPDGPLPGVSLVKDNALYSLQVELVPQPQKGAPPLSSLTAFEQVVGDPHPFFQSGFSGNLPEQMAELREDESYQNLRDLQQEGFSPSVDRGHCYRFIKKYPTFDLKLDVPINREGPTRHLDFARHDIITYVKEGSKRIQSVHAQVPSVKRAMEQLERRIVDHRKRSPERADRAAHADRAVLGTSPADPVSYVKQRRQATKTLAEQPGMYRPLEGDAPERSKPERAERDRAKPAPTKREYPMER